jgi:hypothetical protein
MTLARGITKRAILRFVNLIDSPSEGKQANRWPSETPRDEAVEFEVARVQSLG